MSDIPSAFAELGRFLVTWRAVLIVVMIVLVVWGFRQTEGW